MRPLSLGSGPHLGSQRQWKNATHEARTRDEWYEIFSERPPRYFGWQAMEKGSGPIRDLLSTPFGVGSKQVGEAATAIYRPPGLEQDTQ